jgi:hypothetical protein
MRMAKIAFLLAGILVIASVVLLIKGFWEGIIGQGGVGSFDLMNKSLILAGLCFVAGIVLKRVL